MNRLDVSPRATSRVMAEVTTHLQRATATKRADMVEQFWQRTRSPFIEGRQNGVTRVTFLYRDPIAHQVLLTVNRVTETLEDATMLRVPGSDIWHASFEVGTTWRGTYNFLPLCDDHLAELTRLEDRWAMRAVREQGYPDPRNPQRVETHAGEMSVAVMPKARVLAHPGRSPDEASRTSKHTTPAGRRVWRFTPPAATTKPRPGIVVLDGEVWQRGGRAAAAVDAFAKHHPAEAPFLLFVDCSPNRQVELAADGSMCNEIVDSLLPWWRRHEPGLTTDPTRIFVSGESLGGLTALRTALEYPSRVGGALSQSASLWADHTLDPAAVGNNTRLYLTAGSLERGLVGKNRAFAHGLRGKRFRYLEYDGGHDMAWWQGLWAEGMRFLLEP